MHRMNQWLRSLRMRVIVLSGAWLLTSCGGGDSQVQSVVAVPKALSIQVPASAESSAAVQLGSSAVALDGLRFQWDFGDGTTSGDAVPSHTYARGGEYDLKLTVRNAAGDSTEARSSIVVTSLANVRGLECSGPESTGWCWQNPRPMLIEAPKFYFLDARTGFRTGGAGIIYATTDGGITWKRQRTGASGQILTFRFLDGKTGWAVSNGGEVLRTVDGGDSWAVAQLPSLTYAQNLQIVALNPKVLHVKRDEYHVTYQLSDLYSSSDGGVTWRRIAGQAELSPAGEIWALEGGVLRSSDDAGLSFTQRADFTSAIPGDTGSLALFVFSDTRLVVTRQSSYANGVWYRGSLIISLDGGASWASLSRALPGQSFRLAWASPNGQVFIGEGTSGHPKSQGTWVLSSDGGKTFADVGLSSSTTTQGDVYTARADGGVERYDAQRKVREVSQDGLNWQPPPASAVGCQWPFEFAANGPIPGCLRIDATSRGRQFSLSDDGGKTWRVILDMDLTNTPAYGATSTDWQIDFSGAKRGFMIDANGDGRGTTDGGLTWQVKAPGLGKGRRLHFVGEQTAWLINAEGRLVTSKDGGQTWVQNDGETYNGQSNGPNVKYQDLGFENEKLGWYQRLYPSGDIVFTQYAVTVDGGLSWQQVSLPPSSYYDVSMRLGSKAWLALRGLYSSPELLVSLDQGKTWVSNRAPDAISTPVFSGDATIWALSRLGDRLYRSDDYGVQWRQVALPVKNSRLADVKFANAKVGWIVGSEGLILATKDGGNTWLQQTSSSDTVVPLVALRVSDSQTAWVISLGGAILATGTGGD